MSLIEHLQTIRDFRAQPHYPLWVGVDRQVAPTRDRKPHRTGSVLTPVAGIDPHWVGLQRLIRVERVGTSAKRRVTETLCCISSLSWEAAGLAQRLRQPWHIENRLHWVKDVVLKEDDSP